MEYEPILALFQEFEPFFEARIRIRTNKKNQNPDPHQGDKSNLDLHPDLHPDPHQGDADPKHCILPLQFHSSCYVTVIKKRTVFILQQHFNLNPDKISKSSDIFFRFNVRYY
jgi:hypothetical protein